MDPKEYVHGVITNEEWMDVVSNSCPRVGECGDIYRTNTMESVTESMEMSVPCHYAT